MTDEVKGGYGLLSVKVEELFRACNQSMLVRSLRIELDELYILEVS
jgi:hypothetical protein